MGDLYPRGSSRCLMCLYMMMSPWSYAEGKMRAVNERIQTASPADAGKSWISAPSAEVRPAQCMNECCGYCKSRFRVLYSQTHIENRLLIVEQLRTSCSCVADCHKSAHRGVGKCIDRRRSNNHYECVFDDSNDSTGETFVSLF